MIQDKEPSMLWNSILQALREESDPYSFDFWFSMISFDSFKDDTLYLNAPNSLYKEWIESRYADSIKKVLHRELGNEVSFFLKSNDAAPEKSFPNNNSFLNPRYTFESFVVGNSNKLAHAACYAVADSPSRTYNPLFIYGGVGLGKTHLMQAIGSSIMSKNPSYSVVYVSSEHFTNELISSIKDDKTAAFRNRYRNVDVLLIDDIQFLAGKERTQEEFFHTFSTLYEANKQVVISSDRPPKDIPNLEERLHSRFVTGLITDIEPPDYETRVAILRKKAQAEGLNIPYDVLDYIANYIDSNIRELEGALVRLIAYSSISKTPLNLKNASIALKDILPPPKPIKITIEAIQKAVTKHYDTDMKDLVSKKRNREFVFPRQLAMYLCRRMTDASSPQIGYQFGGRDHTTVLHACNKIESILSTDSDLKTTIEILMKKIDPSYLK